MTESEIPDWLQDDRPELTEEEVRAAWRRIAKADLTDKKISLGCSGGDGYEIDAVIEKVITILGVGILFRIKGATIVSQDGSDSDYRQPIELPRARYILLDDFNFPPEFKEGIIVLSGGGLCLNGTGEVKFGGCLCCGFIFL